ncbi:MAG: NAD(P)/FAD-dependent oxidoreductase [Dermabacter sp.]|nr:NAD(P)/FAD-dependent oxidoreductase [Dermabacter sp.]
MPRSFRPRPRVIPAPDGHTWPHVVVIGGGFAGVTAVRQLRKARVRVTLIDRNVYKTFQPLLYQVATAGLNPGDVTMFLRGIQMKAANMRFRQGEVTHIDCDEQIVHLGDGGRVRYDYLVLANGATTNFFGTAGAEEYAMPMYTRSQALAIRERIFAELERASQLSETGTNDKLHVSIVGGGPTGVEIAGALADFRIHELDVLYPEMDPGTLEIALVQRGTELLKGFEAEHRGYAARELEARGVQLVLGEGVDEVGYDFVRLSDGRILESDITIWAAGVGVDERVKAWGLPQGPGGRIAVEDSLRVSGMPNVWAAGDVAGQKVPQPQLAQPAVQTGTHVARAITALTEGREADSHRPFHYVDLGAMATIGRQAAIATLPGGIQLNGAVGWFAWLGVHVTKLIGTRNRRSVAANLLYLYSGTGKSRTPNPVVGEVDSNKARIAFKENSPKRKFGYGAGGSFPNPGRPKTRR